jgi:hypothetical protein
MAQVRMVNLKKIFEGSVEAVKDFKMRKVYNSTLRCRS